MAEVSITVAGRNYAVACGDGEERHLLMLANLVDEKARAARQSAPGLTEARQLLFAALFLADELADLRKAKPGQASLALDVEDDADIAGTLEAMAERMDKLAEKLAGNHSTP